MLGPGMTRVPARPGWSRGVIRVSIKVAATRGVFPMLARLLSSLLFTLCLSGAAQAAEIFWSTTANTCVPADATIRFNRDKVNLASVQHAADSVDLIILNCPVTRFEIELHNWIVKLTYRDSTGTGAAASVRAQLYRMPIGGVNPVPLAEVNSNSSAITGNSNVNSANFQHTFDFATQNYWIRVELDRSTTGQTVIFHSVALLGDLT
jgi:hypothetical protein